MSNTYKHTGLIESSQLQIENNGIITTITTNATANRTVTFPNSTGNIAVGGGTTQFATFDTLGPFASLAASNPITYANTAINTIIGLMATTGIQGPFVESGTVFTVPAGTYEVKWRQTFSTAGAGTVLYFGTTLGTMARVASTAIGQNAINTASCGNVIQVVPIGGGFLAVCADANEGPVSIPATTNGTNASVTSVIISKI